MRHLGLLLILLLCGLQPGHAQSVLNANAGPSNNGGGVNSAILFDLQASTGVVITGLTTATATAAGGSFQVNVFTRAGTALGGPVASGPGSSNAGWTLRGTVTATQGSGEISLPIQLPELPIAAGQTLGVALQFPDTSPRYFGTGTAALEIYQNSNLMLTTGDARSAPFTTGGSFFSSRALVGSIRYRLADPVLPANPGPSNNGGANDSGFFFNLQSSTGVVVTGLTTASSAPVGTNYQIEVYTRAGTALGNTTGSGPATSSSGWTMRGLLNVTQSTSEVSLPVQLPSLIVPAGQTLGVGLVFRGAGPSYFGTGTPPLENYGSGSLSLVTGEAMTTPFSSSSAVFASRALVGSISWRPLASSLPANPGPSNNGGNVGSAMFLDLQPITDVVISGLTTASSTPANSNFQLQVYTRTGSTLGGSSSTGPTTANAGWTLHATVTGTQGATGQVSLPITIPDLAISAGQTVGVALVFVDTGPAYFGSGVTAPVTYVNSNLRVTTGEARSAPFTTTGTFFVSRELIGTVFYRADVLFRNGFE